MRKKNIIFTFTTIIAFIFVLIISNLIPFFTIPTLVQSAWATGFAHSLANQSLFSITANNIGIPHPASIAFGLSAVIPMSWFIRLGFHGIDAYVLSFICFYILAFWGAFRIARLYKVDSYVSLLLSVLWLTFPVVIKHLGYSMLGLGIALIPFYVYVFLHFKETWSSVLHFKNIRFKHIQIAAIYFITSALAVFMDGYSFVMFAAATTFLLAADVIHKKKLFIFVWLCHGFVLWSTFVLYDLYIGTFTFSISPIDFFRGWGLDLSFLFIPTRGDHWLWDVLKLSIPRSRDEFFGDGSTWRFTFSLPLLLVSGYFIYKNRTKSQIIIYALLFILSLYMALGPSLKFFSTKQDKLTYEDQIMPASFAIMSTGNEVLYKKIPGIRNMRATYRWTALAVFALWMTLIISLGMQKNTKKTRMVSIGLVSLLILLYVPNIVRDVRGKRTQYQEFHQIDTDIVKPLGAVLNKNDTIVFLPHRNDFILNYVASKLDTKTYNIGGDKNVEMAHFYWPAELKQMPAGSFDDPLTETIPVILTNGTADKVILPFFNTIAGNWNEKNKTVYKKEVMTLAKSLEQYPHLHIQQFDYFYVITLNTTDSSSMK